MKKFFIKMLIVCVSLVTWTPAHCAHTKVLISQIVNHPALDATVRGIVDGLAAHGYKKDENLEIRIESAQASPTLAAQIAAKFVNQSPDLVIGVGTLSAQSFIKYAMSDKVRLVFSSVSDPQAAGLALTKTRGFRNISGVSNFTDPQLQIDVLLAIQPNLKKVGILYNMGEINSVKIVDQLSEICRRAGIILEKQTISRVSEVSQAVTRLATKVDAMIINNDNTALSALQTITSIATRHRIPVYISDLDAIGTGALIAIGPDQYKLGLQTGAMAASILKGKNINEVAIQQPRAAEVHVNSKAAQSLSISVPEKVRKLDIR